MGQFLLLLRRERENKALKSSSFTSWFYVLFLLSAAFKLFICKIFWVFIDIISQDLSWDWIQIRKAFIVVVGWMADLTWLGSELNLSGRYFFIEDKGRTAQKKKKKKMRSFTNFSVVINNEEMRDFDLIVCLPLKRPILPFERHKYVNRIIFNACKRRLYYINAHVHAAHSKFPAHLLCNHFFSFSVDIALGPFNQKTEENRKKTQLNWKRPERRECFLEIFPWRYEK